MKNTKPFSSEVAFIDLDGTLIDVTERLYRVFVALTGARISFEEYWRLKDTGAKQRDLLRHCNYDGDYELFSHEWLAEIEKTHWLDYDKKTNGADSFLQEMRTSFSLVLCTNRQYREGVLQEVERFGWQCLFEALLVTEQKKTKSQMMVEYLRKEHSGIMIGDSAEDEQAAYITGIPFYYVSHRREEGKDGFSRVLNTLFDVK